MKEKLLIRPLTDGAAWEEDHPGIKPGIFNSRHFVEVLRSEKRKPAYFHVLENGEIVAKLAGLEIVSALGQPILCFYSSPAERPGGSACTAEIIRELVRYARSRNIGRVILRCYDSCRVFALSDPFFRCSNRSEYIVHLNTFSDDIRGHFKKSVRRNIMRAERSLPVFKEDFSREAAQRLVALMKQTQEFRLSKGGKKYNCFYLPYFDEISLFSLVNSRIGRLFYAITDGIIHCIQLVLVHEERSYSLFMGTSREGYAQGLPSYLDFRVMEKLKSEGVEYFNLGGVSDPDKDKGLAAYKRAIGGVECRMTGGSTNFLRFPFAALNPFLKIGRNLPNSALVKYLRKIFE